MPKLPWQPHGHGAWRPCKGGACAPHPTQPRTREAPGVRVTNHSVTEECTQRYDYAGTNGPAPANATDRNADRRSIHTHTRGQRARHDSCCTSALHRMAAGAFAACFFRDRYQDVIQNNTAPYVLTSLTPSASRGSVQVLTDEDAVLVPRPTVYVGLSATSVNGTCPQRVIMTGGAVTSDWAPVPVSLAPPL